ncbi:MAG: hypothetical protein WCW25_05510 [Patescibacteria group bacterium]|jgi:hypothetical protein
MYYTPYILASYVFIVFGLSRFAIPHLNSRPEKIPDKISEDMENAINELRAGSKSAGEFLNLTFNYIGNKFRSERFNTILKFHYLFFPLEKVWPMSGYMPCTISNFMLTVFLVKSGYFKAEDIKKKHVFVNFIPHQYLKMKVGESWIDVDVGEKQRGLPIGKHLRFFG